VGDHKEDKMNEKIPKSLGLIISIILLSTGLTFGAEPIKIGIIYPLTGPNAAAGSYVLSGVQIATDKFNAEGGIIGRPVKLFIEDGANDPAQSVSAAEILVTRDKVDLMIAAWGSSPTLAVSASVTKKYGVPQIVDTASSVKVTKQDGKRPNPWLFRIQATSQLDAEGTEPYLVPKMGFTKVALMAVNNDWGRGAAEEFGTVIKRSGGMVVTTELFNAEAADFLTQLTKIKNTDANSIVITTDISQSSLILKQYKQLGMKQKIFFTDVGTTAEGLVEMAGKEPAEGVYIYQVFCPQFPELTQVPNEAKSFIAEYRRRNLPEKGFGESVHGYEAMRTIKAALEKAKTADKESVRKALQEVDAVGLMGRIKFDEFGQNKPTLYILQVKDSKPAIPDFLKK
jgi:branched-chain amino acid transport system substrate-binding protein